MQRKVRIFLNLDEIEIGCQISINNKNEHYIKNVMRLKKNDRIFIFNKKAEWVAEIFNLSPCIIIPERLVRMLEVENREIIAIICPIKSKRMQILIEKIIEIGINGMIFARSKNTVINEINTKKFDSWINEATEQSEQIRHAEIIYLPELNLNLNQLANLTTTINAISHELIIVFDKRGHDIFSKEIATKIESISRIYFIIGPEGGFSISEIEYFKSRSNIIICKLCETNLRAETAATVAAYTLRNYHLS
ncbi:RsmE family RNA methyltransferase [Candidatus Gromoviella agglomerans]|uniref:RsmE family RNA methyltransferase n=1 Tax=Candidatus Gromoviella agglomerans TaxID=2806609 RepID=UPI001E60DCB4|nr:RsmE family RNA methyltransferase [Candidatus Gromoviella agglomerans]UFX98199.1 Ribosomal RNA small subunit methyltransferase E family protein [Candidatus Gromoviella agglomerans]